MVLVEPVVTVEEEELLAPEHAGDGLAHDVGRVRGDGRRGHGAVELVRLLQPGGQGLVKLRTEGGCGDFAFPAFAGRGHGGEAQPQGCRIAGFYFQPVVRRDLGAPLFGIHCTLIALYHAVVDAVFHVRAVVRIVGKESGIIRFILGKEQRHLAFAGKNEFTQQRMRCRDRARARRCLDLLEVRLLGCPVGFGNPGCPVIPEPECRQEMQFGCVRSPVGRRDPHQDVFRTGFGVLHEDVEIAVGLEDARVEELILHLVPGAPLVGVHQVGVRKGRLGVFVEVLHVGVGRRRVEVEVVFLDILAVIAFAVGQTEQALLEDGIPAVPQGKGKAQPLFVVGQAGQAVLSPSVGPRAGLIVGEEIPGIAPLAVVLTNRPPLPLAQVGTPFLPGNLLLAILFEADLFSGS